MYTDIAIKVPLGHYSRVAPKSGITLKHHVTVLAGVIDPDYTGNVGVVLHNLSSDTKFTRQVGQPIGQLILEVASIFPTLEVGGLPITAQDLMVLAVKISPEELLESKRTFKNPWRTFIILY